MRSYCCLGIALSLLTPTTLFGARSLRQGQVFLNGSATMTAVDMAIRNVSQMVQNVCAVGGAVNRYMNPGTMQVAMNPTCALYVAQTSPDISPAGYGSTSNPCVRMPPNGWVNFHIRQATNSPGCPGLQHGYFEVTFTVAEDRGAVSGSMLVTQGAPGGDTQAFTPLNGGRPF